MSPDCPPRHQCCLAVFCLPRRSQNVKSVELTRSDREILHVWPGCLSKFGILLVVWGKCWKLLEIWTKPSIQRLLVSCWGNPSIKHQEIWARRIAAAACRTHQGVCGISPDDLECYFHLIVFKKWFLLKITALLLLHQAQRRVAWISSCQSNLGEGSFRLPLKF